MNPATIVLIMRLLTGVLNFVSRKEVKYAEESPADVLSDGGELHKSDKNFSDISK